MRRSARGLPKRKYSLFGNYRLRVGFVNPLLGERPHLSYKLNKPLSALCQLIFNARRDFGIGVAHDQAVAFQLMDTLVQHLRRETWQGAQQLSRAIDALTQRVQYRHRPLAPQDVGEAVERLLLAVLLTRGRYSFFRTLPPSFGLASISFLKVLRPTRRSL